MDIVSEKQKVGSTTPSLQPSSWVALLELEGSQFPFNKRCLLLLSYITSALSHAKGLGQIKLAILLSTTLPPKSIIFPALHLASWNTSLAHPCGIIQLSPLIPSKLLPPTQSSPSECVFRFVCLRVLPPSGCSVFGHSSWRISPCAPGDQWSITENAFVCYLHCRPQDPICYPEPSFWCNWDFLKLDAWEPHV